MINRVNNADFATCPTWAAIAAFLVGTVFAIPTTAHEFDDGFVERSVYVVIRDRTVNVEYCVGCNAKTMEDAIAKWAEKGEPDGSSPKQIEEKQKSTAEDPPLMPPLEQQFQTDLLAQVAKNLVIKVANRPLQLKPVSVESSPRHHVNAVATLELALPEADSLTLAFQDMMFSENAGGVRYAAKSLGNAVMSRSNVATIIIRADRHELNELTPEQRLEKTKIDCQLVFVSSDEK